jgi:hypothetical protein
LKAEMVKMVERQMREFNGQAEILIRHMIRQEFQRIADETRAQLLAAIPTDIPVLCRACGATEDPKFHTASRCAAIARVPVKLNPVPPSNR